jgi:hypothetical protein
MVKIWHTGFLKLNFEIIPKKCIFRFLPKSPHALDEVEYFFCLFSNPWALRVSGGWVVIPQNVKKSQNHCIVATILKISCVE